VVDFSVEASREPPMVPMVLLPTQIVGEVEQPTGQPLQSVEALPVVQDRVPMARVQSELQHEQRPQERLFGRGGGLFLFLFGLLFGIVFLFGFLFGSGYF
jgi:hypothetical protein